MLILLDDPVSQCFVSTRVFTKPPPLQGKTQLTVPQQHEICVLMIPFETFKSVLTAQNAL